MKEKLWKQFCFEASVSDNLKTTVKTMFTKNENLKTRINKESEPLQAITDSNNSNEI